MNRRLIVMLAAIVCIVAVAGSGPLGARSTVSFGGQTSEDISIVPYAPIKLAIQTQSQVTHEFSVDVFPVGIDDYRAVRSGQYRGDDDFGVPAVRHETGTTPGTNYYSDQRQVALAGLPIGLYVARVSAGDRSAYRAIDVSTFGVISTMQRDGALFYATDLRTFHRRADVTFAPADDPAAAKPSTDGLATFASTDDSVESVARAADGSVALADARRYYYYGNDSDKRAFGQTDRPLYHPGDRVEYRFITRNGHPGAYTVPTGSDAITIADQSGKALATASPAFTSYGTANGSYTIPESASLGTYRISDDDSAVTFDVQAYVKPEYEVDVSSSSGSSVVAGTQARFEADTKYFFGAPAAGMHLHYRATPQFRWQRWFGRVSFWHFANYDVSTNNSNGGPAIEGDLVAGPDGKASFTIPTTADQADRDLDVSVDARDSSGKTVTGATSIAVTHAAFEVSASFASWFASKGSESTITVRSQTVDEKAIPNVPVTLSFAKRDWSTNPATVEQLGTAQVTTDAAGVTTYTWHPQSEGYVDVTATAVDADGHTASRTTSIWVSGGAYSRWYRFNDTSVVAEKSTYRPGETARLLVTSPRADVDALVHVWGAAGSQTFVKHLATIADTIEVRAPAGTAHFAVTVWVPTSEGFGQGEATLDISPAPHQLHVKLTPQKAKYQPGETARFAVDVVDDTGRPASAEVGIGVVDDALLALATPNSADPFDTFYHAERPGYASSTWHNLNAANSIFVWDQRLRSIARVTARNPGSAFAPGTTEDQYTVNAEQGAPPRPTFDHLRSDFRDTAYWSPTVVTDTSGHANVTFTWPDNLTSYTASGLAVTQSTDIGTGHGTSLVTKDFLVRLATPRFMRTSDSARFVASANGPKNARTALLRFSAPALGIADDSAVAKFDGNAATSREWNVSATTRGPSKIRLAGTTGALTDGVQRSIPVESTGVAAHVRSSGSLPAAPTTAFVLSPNDEAGDLRIDLAPSVVAQLFGDVHLLDVYPYYCVEQTMSSALPLILVERLAKRTGLAIPKGVDPNDVATHAVKRLGQLQHGDGSWGWWEHDDANPYMTAYALYGLAELRKQGRAVPDDMLARGIDSLVTQLFSENDTRSIGGEMQADSKWNTRAYMLYSLGNAAPDRVDREMLAKVDAKMATLNPYALSVLGLAHVEIGDKAGAAPLLEELLRRAKDTGTYTHWSGGGWHYHWEDDPIETTAYALRFLHAMTPSDPRVQRTINWLRSKSHGSWWYTTKDTAAAIYALTDAIDPDRSEFDPHETADVYVNDRLVKSVKIDSPLLNATDATVTVPASALANGGTVRFERNGKGGLYWDADWTRYVKDGTPSASEIGSSDARALDADTATDFTISRSYGSKENATWKLGDEVDVDVAVTSKDDAQFVAIEDPLPAGLEYQPRLHEQGDRWSGLQFFDDKVVFFATQMWPNETIHLHYTLRASTAGRFTAAPPTAYAMYGPPVSAIGHAKVVTILP